MTEESARQICRRAIMDARRKHGGDEVAANREVAAQALKDSVLMSALFIVARERAGKQE